MPSANGRRAGDRMGWSAEHPLDLRSPLVALRGNMGGAALYDRGAIVRRWDDPLDALRWLPTSWRAGAIRSDQSWLGYLGYDLGRCFERLPATAAERLHTPLFAFGHTP